VNSPRALIDDAARRLAAAGVESPQLDAQLLLAHCLGVERGRLVTIDRVDAVQERSFSELVLRRARREPLQYLVGSAPFRFGSVAVGPGVFIPRPETELLVDAVLADLRAIDTPLVIDLCAGSGALALAVARELPTARVIAVERSPAAIEWLRRNCAGTRVEITEADVRDPQLLVDFRGRVDAVVSNPPYVPSSTVVGPEVAHDPAEAVFAGPDGLDLIPDVIARAADLLRTGGAFALEHDESHGDGVVQLLQASRQWTDVADHLDLTGRPRYVTATRDQ
jgi:release factor glutamine methyltransferase